MARNGNSSLRPALIEAAARLIATEGAAGLTLRRVADEVGTSTMAIYTYFGGMRELRRAVRQEGFAQLAARAAQRGESDDPVADLARLGLDYYEHAMSDPHMYRVMYMEQPLDAADAAAGSETFNLLTAGVQRCIDAGRFDQADAAELATQFWAFSQRVAESLQRLGRRSRHGTPVPHTRRPSRGPRTGPHRGVYQP